MVNCTDFQCPRESHFKKQNIGENVSCDGDDDDDNDNCKEKCCNQYTICGEWSFHDNECRNGKYPSPSRTIPSEIYDDKDIYNLSVENVNVPIIHVQRVIRIRLKGMKGILKRILKRILKIG